MVKRIYLLLVALTLVLVIVGGQVQAQLENRYIPFWVDPTLIYIRPI